jgi:hypothetical protein
MIPVHALLPDIPATRKLSAKTLHAVPAGIALQPDRQSGAQKRRNAIYVMRNWRANPLTLSQCLVINGGLRGPIVEEA